MRGALLQCRCVLGSRHKKSGRGVIQKIGKLGRGVRGVERNENGAEAQRRKVQQQNLWGFIDLGEQALAGPQAERL